MVRNDEWNWETARDAYESRSHTRIEIARRLGISPSQLRRSALTRGWKRDAPTSHKLASETASRAAAAEPSHAPSETLPAKPAGASPARRASLRTPRGRKQFVDRLYEALERKLTMIEQHLSASEPPSPADGERLMRDLNQVIASLDKIGALDAVRPAATADGSAASLVQPGGAGDDQERFRRELADRIARLRRSWPGGSADREPSP